MSLYLVEIALENRKEEEIAKALDSFARVLTGSGELIEAQVGVEAGRTYLIVEAADVARVEEAAKSAGLSVTNTKEVHLVGAELADIKGRAGKANYLVEWNLPAGLTMERYLKRKQEKSVRYEEVPELSFERTYVCTDMSKCLCFYDSPSEELVKKGRELVEAPIDTLTTVKQVGD